MSDTITFAGLESLYTLHCAAYAADIPKSSNRTAVLMCRATAPKLGLCRHRRDSVLLSSPHVPFEMRNAKSMSACSATIKKSPPNNIMLRCVVKQMRTKLPVGEHCPWVSSGDMNQNVHSLSNNKMPNTEYGCTPFCQTPVGPPTANANKPVAEPSHKNELNSFRPPSP